MRKGKKQVIFFEIDKLDRKTKARLGVIHTAHGDIQTPSFVPVGTQAVVKALCSQDLEQIGVSVFFVNTYHTYLRPGLSVIEKFDGLHRFMNWNKPLMTDSAGFQIFSLASGKNRSRKQELSIKDTENGTIAPLVKIDENGVEFRSHLDGSKHIFTPERSIEIQSILGADIMIAFDECTYYPSSHDYADKAMQRTHRWALRCLAATQGKLQDKQKKYQALYGVVQGGVYGDLRKESAKFIGSLPFEGIAIGGVSVGESKKEMRNVLDWVIPNLPEEKPRHLLGVGEIDDIFTAVEQGVDTFDCVMPTRLGRTGFALAKLKTQNAKLKTNKEKFLIDLNKSVFETDKKPIDEGCQCFVCKNYSRAYLHHLFRARELSVYRLLSFHNLYFVEKLVEQIRTSIKEGNFNDLKKDWL